MSNSGAHSEGFGGTGLRDQESEDVFIGWIQHLLTTGEIVFIPFVCRKCGKCCREVSVHPDHFNPYEIADYLNLSVREVVETYFGEITYLNSERVEWKQTKSRKPCAFHEENKCKIYPIRPGPCRAFPISTDFGDSGIGCPGRLEYVRARKRLGRGIPYYTEPYWGDTRPEVHVKTKRWKKTLDKYLSINPCEKAIKIFIQSNNPMTKT